MTKEDKQLKKLYKIISNIVNEVIGKKGHKIHKWVEVEKFIKANFVSKQWVREELKMLKEAGMSEWSKGYNYAVEEFNKQVKDKLKEKEEK